MVYSLLKKVLEKSKIDPNLIEDVCMGNVRSKCHCYSSKLMSCRSVMARPPTKSEQLRSQQASPPQLAPHLWTDSAPLASRLFKTSPTRSQKAASKSVSPSARSLCLWVETDSRSHSTPRSWRTQMRMIACNLWFRRLRTSALTSTLRERCRMNTPLSHSDVLRLRRRLAGLMTRSSPLQWRSRIPKPERRRRSHWPRMRAQDTEPQPKA